ncbi:MAG: hypothetical protein ABI857_05450 [Acidobacteriota bacterium]
MGILGAPLGFGVTRNFGLSAPAMGGWNLEPTRGLLLSGSIVPNILFLGLVVGIEHLEEKVPNSLLWQF